MPKISKSCVQCGATFSFYPARQRDADKRGIEIKFCSRACTAAARASGVIRSRNREGHEVACSICGAMTYRKQSKLQKNTLHFCSEPCRIKAQQIKLLDRSGENSGPRKKLRNGAEIPCVICGVISYRKKSYLERKMLTCGSRKCKSDYHRAQWGLPPCSDEERRRSGQRGLRPKRRTNFTAKQRIEWLDKTCKRCGSTQNLADRKSVV